jgi:glycosyltransferase involved in cell wall biosynthesis
VAQQRRPHVLFVAFYFPPTRASGVYRSRAIANHFVALGWDVTVVTVQREFFQHYTLSFDPSLEATVSPQVRVERVPFSGWQWETDVRRLGVARVLFPKTVTRLRRTLDSVRFPDAYASWIPGVVRRAREVHAEHPVDVVLATGNPWSAFGAAREAATGIGAPYVLDYRDAWTMNQYTEARTGRRSRVVRAESRVLADCALAVFVNEAQRAWHAERHPEVADRTLVVENGWEPEILGDLPVRLPDPDRPLRLAYVGTMTTYMPLPEFFEGWRLARRDPLLAGATITLHGHLGFFVSSGRRIRALLPLDEDIDVAYEGPLAKAGVAAGYEPADVLLLILPGSRYVTSGKVYEYMATGKPIVSVHDPESSANEPLRNYPLWFPVRDLSPEAIADALTAAAAAARTMTTQQVEQGQAHALRYTRTAQLEPLAERLGRLVAARRSAAGSVARS